MGTLSWPVRVSSLKQSQAYPRRGDLHLGIASSRSAAGLRCCLMPSGSFLPVTSPLLPTPGLKGTPFWAHPTLAHSIRPPQHQAPAASGPHSIRLSIWKAQIVGVDAMAEMHRACSLTFHTGLQNEAPRGKCLWAAANQQAHLLLF